MNRQTFFLAALIWAGCEAGALLAHQAPARAPLPNFDQRTSRGAALASADAGPTAGSFRLLTAAQKDAAVALLDRVPGLVVAGDRVVGAPRLVGVRGGFLTGPGGTGKAVTAATLNAFPKSDRHRVIKAFLNEHSSLFGHDATVLATARIKRDFVTPHNGLRTVVWEQVFQGVPVFDGLLQGHITAREELTRLSSQLLADPAVAARIGAADWATRLSYPPLSARAAVARAAANVEVQVSEAAVSPLGAPEGAVQAQQFKAPGLNGVAYAQLIWLPTGRNAMVLAWDVILTSRARGEMYRLVVDAQTGNVVIRRCLTAYQAAPVAASYMVYTSDSPSPFSPGHPTPSSDQPPLVERTHLTNLVALSLTASPAGWLNPAVQGFYSTLGNNVAAHTDLDDNDDPDLPRPRVAQDDPDFDFPLDLTLPPNTYTNASVVNLFYLNNFMHDVLYGYGFTEEAGNFQNNNFGRGGFGNDAVQADAQDGAGLNDFFHVNNANFATPPDGYPGRMQMYLFNGPQPDRDGSLDSEVVCHEYTHGLSNRLVGGGVGISELQPAGMGEGWSDFYPLVLLSEPADDPNGTYAVGGYATYLFYDLTENYYFGIRRYPYTTDMTKNPLTFKDIDPTQADPHFGVPRNPVLVSWEGEAAEVHNQGEVWCATLWEARVNLVEALGFEEGNQTVLQLVTDGMKLCPPNPTWIEARDAILEADLINYGGANRTELWLAFAKRGMGYSASAPTSDKTIGVVEAFDLPDDLVISPPDGILEVVLIPGTESTLLSGADASLFVRVRDGTSVTNAVVRGVVNGVTPVVFGNDGAAPDVRARDSIYSTTVTVPSTGTNMALVVTVTAPSKFGATNSATYYIAARPSNDLFANALKVRGEGGVLPGNNRYATPSLEQGEPRHAGVASAVSSLWWSWTPTANSRALVDTGGSRFNTLLAVYTGSAVSNLTEVSSAASAPQSRQGFVQFDARKGETYRIAVASSSTNNAGQINLRIAPDGVPDLTPPLLNVTKPVNGLILSTNVVDVVASAQDPGPVSSGVERITFLVTPVNTAPSFPWTAGLTASTNRLALTAGLNTINVTAVDGVGNVSEPSTIQLTYRPKLVANDHFSAATALPGSVGTVTASTTQATREPGEPRHADNDGGHSVWWSWRAPADGSLLLSTDGSAFDTLLGLYTGTRVDRLTAVAANDDAFESSGFSKLQTSVVSNQVYSVAVDGFNGASGTVNLAYEFTPSGLLTVELQASAGGSIKERAPGRFTVPANSSQTFTAVPDFNYRFDRWAGSVVSMANPLAVQVNSNMVVRAVFVPVLFTDDFETGDLSHLAWVTQGDPAWSVTDTEASGGQYSARSGSIGHGQTSSLLLTGTFYNASASFDFRVSSEAGWDFFAFYVDGLLVQRWSGELDWATFSATLPAGTHTLEWRYSKDAQTSFGEDAAFLDSLSLPLLPPADSTTPARLTLRRVPQGQYELLITGQENQLYVLEQTTNAPPNRRAVWTPVSTNAAERGEIRFILSAPPPDVPHLFYRAITP